jgi:hypothetical protein
VQFDAPVVDDVVPFLNEKTGTALRAGGGDPGKAYIAFEAAMRSGDVEALKGLYRDQAKRRQTPPAGRKYASHEVTQKTTLQPSTLKEKIRRMEK